MGAPRAAVFFQLVHAELTPGLHGDEALEIRLVPSRPTSTSAENIAEVVRQLIKKEGAHFKGKSVRVLIEDVQVCRECGCWEEEACDQGCEWVEPDLCSACVSQGKR